MCVRVCAHAHIHMCFSGGQQVANKSVLQGRAQIVSASGAASSLRSECPHAKVDLFKRYWLLETTDTEDRLHTNGVQPSQALAQHF